VPGETDVTHLAGLFRGEDALEGAAGGKVFVGIGHAADVVELDEVDVVGLEALEGGVDLVAGALGVAGVDLGHEESLVPVAITQRLAHANFALAIVINPGVVHEVDPGVDGSADDLRGQGFRYPLFS
jgi:hypothetical protein